MTRAVPRERDMSREGFSCLTEPRAAARMWRRSADPATEQSTFSP